MVAAEELVQLEIVQLDGEDVVAAEDVADAEEGEENFFTKSTEVVADKF